MFSLGVVYYLVNININLCFHRSRGLFFFTFREHPHRYIHLLIKENKKKETCTSKGKEVLDCIMKLMFPYPVNMAAVGWT